MLKLNTPVYSFEQAMDTCCQGITGNKNLLQKLESEMGLLKVSADNYIKSASSGKLFAIQPTPNRPNSDLTVIGSLTKSELLKLYSTYILKSGKPGRKIYSALMAAANEKCPFCGGIGRPRNLDHYLPKARYPQYAILPMNLVPSCRDCNMDGKGQNLASSEEEQVLQPYLDSDCYFSEQWVFARYIAGDSSSPGVIEYFVRPPEYWDDTKKRRVEKHFDDFDLNLRFSKEAGPRLNIYLAQISGLTQISIELEEAKNTILTPAIESASFLNHWERVMCLALMNDLV